MSNNHIDTIIFIALVVTILVILLKRLINVKDEPASKWFEESQVKLHWRGRLKGLKKVKKDE